jgi:hypothetical protein
MVNGLQSNTSTNATSSSLNVTSATGDLVIDFLCVEGASTAPTVDASQTQFVTVNDASGPLDAVASREAGAATTTMSWTTISAFNDFYHAAFNINDALARRPASPMVIQ